MARKDWGTKGRLVGGKELSATLRGLEAKVFRKATRRGVDDATKIVLDATRSKVPTRTRSLKRALGRKVVAFRTGAGYLGVVGPRRDLTAKRKAELAAQGKRVVKDRYRKVVLYRGREILVNPVNYAHLVEFGRRAVRVRRKRLLSDGSVVFGVSVRSVPPRPFVRPAWESSKASAEAAIRGRLKDAVDQAKRG